MHWKKIAAFCSHEPSSSAMKIQSQQLWGEINNSLNNRNNSVNQWLIEVMCKRGQYTSVRMVRTSLNSFVVLIKRFFRLSTTVVVWVVVSVDMLPLSFWELLRSCRSTTAALSPVMSCLITAVNSWISTVGSSKTDVLFATVRTQE